MILGCCSALSSHRFVCLAAAEKLEFLFVIRNGKESAENFAFASWTMHSILRGDEWIRTTARIAAGLDRLRSLWT